MSKILLGLAVVCATIFSNPISPISQSYARVILKEKVKYYRVTGSTGAELYKSCLLYTSPSPRDRQKSRMPSSA